MRSTTDAPPTRQKKLTASDADDYLRAQIALYRTGKAAGARLAAATGAPVLRNEQARQDLAWLGTITRRYADAVGVEASRTALGRIGKTELSPAKQNVLNALRVGDVNETKAAFREYMAAVPKDKQTDARKSLMATIRASQPIRVGVAGEARREVFLAYARKNLPKEDVARVMRIDQRYRDTAAKAGLFSAGSVTEKQ